MVALSLRCASRRFYLAGDASPEHPLVEPAHLTAGGSAKDKIGA
jgi:hypothetical protein